MAIRTAYALYKTASAKSGTSFEFLACARQQRSRAAVTRTPLVYAGRVSPGVLIAVFAVFVIGLVFLLRGARRSGQKVKAKMDGDFMAVAATVGAQPVVLLGNRYYARLEHGGLAYSMRYGLAGELVPHKLVLFVRVKVPRTRGRRCYLVATANSTGRTMTGWQDLGGGLWQAPALKAEWKAQMAASLQALGGEGQALMRQLAQSYESATLVNDAEVGLIGAGEASKLLCASATIEDLELQIKVPFSVPLGPVLSQLGAAALGGSARRNNRRSIATSNGWE